MLAVFNVNADPSHTGLLLVIVGVGGNALIINDTDALVGLIQFVVLFFANAYAVIVPTAVALVPDIFIPPRIVMAMRATAKMPARILRVSILIF